MLPEAAVLPEAKIRYVKYDDTLVINTVHLRILFLGDPK